MEIKNIKKSDNKVISTLYVIVTTLIGIALVIFIIHAFRIGALTSNEALVKYVKGFGIIAPIIFMLIQIIQCIIPIIPGGASCAAGVLAFGPITGFIYNYISLVLGSIIVFYISKKYGMKIITKLFKSKTINKYIKYIRNKTFDKVFTWGIIIPGFPDDLLCYIAGVSSISDKRFFVSILIGKPISLILYSVGMYYLPSFIL